MGWHWVFKTFGFWYYLSKDAIACFYLTVKRSVGMHAFCFTALCSQLYNFYLVIEMGRKSSFLTSFLTSFLDQSAGLHTTLNKFFSNWVVKVYFSLIICVCILTCIYGCGQLLTVKITSEKKKDLVKEYWRNFLYFVCRFSSNPIVEVSDNQKYFE